MKFTIKQLDITVELDDKLVKEYEKYDTLTEHSFVIGILATYDHKYNDVSNEELSKICNEIMAGDIEVYKHLPAIVSFMEKNVETFKKAAEEGICMEMDLD